MSKYFDSLGNLKLAPKEDKPYKPKRLTEQEQKLIDICLNCSKKKCSGNCTIIKQIKRRKENETESRNN